MSKQNKYKDELYPQLKKVSGSEYCAFSVVENKLKKLYENQEIIYKLLIEINEKLKNEQK
jgi:hypothetical protein